MKSIFAMMSTLMLFFVPCNLLAQSNQQPANSSASSNVNRIGSPPIEFTIHPGAPSQPALKTRLFPDSQDLIKRNAAIYYHRAVYLQDALRSEFQFQDATDKSAIAWPSNEAIYDRWLQLPLDEMPIDDMRVWLDLHDGVFGELRRAQRSSYCDWQILPDTSEEINPVSVSMSEIQQLRETCRILVVGIRVAVFDQDFSQAIEYLRMGYRMVHDVNQLKSSYGCMTARALATMITRQQLMLAGRPAAPNLYWPTANIPVPLNNFRDALRYEMSRLNGPESVLKSLRSPALLPANTDQWNQRITDDAAVVAEYGGWPRTGQNPGPLAAVLAMRAYPFARQSLLDSGYAADKVASLPVAQVIAIHETKAIQFWNDELLKHLNLPTLQLRERLRQYQGQQEVSFLSGINGGTTEVQPRLLTPWLPIAVPYAEGMADAELIVQRELTLLQVIDALRAHVAVTGTLPKKLAEVSILPVPNNPATSKPFKYRQTDSGATLRVDGSGIYQDLTLNLKLAK